MGHTFFLEMDTVLSKNVYSFIGRSTTLNKMGKQVTINWILVGIEVG